VIVRCERCDTRFKLDASRIPARGARVRCSRCKHAFFVVPAGKSRDARVHDAAAEAARGASRPPEAAWDLEEAAQTARGASAVAARPSSEAEDDSEWRFEDELPGIDTGSSSLGSVAGDGRAPAQSPSDPNENSFAGLGDPTTWDLTGAAAPASPAAPRRRAPAPPVHTEAPQPAAAPAVAPPVEAAVAAAAPAVEATPPASLAAAPRRTSSLAALAGWCGFALLAALAAWGGLRPPPAATSPTMLAPVAGFDVVSAEARRVENGVSGTLLVISGRLRNPGPAPRALGVTPTISLLDADGEPLSAHAEAGAPLGAAQLREDDPDALRRAAAEAASELARTVVASGEQVAFEAVFPDAPPPAARFTLAAGAPPAR
jgi:predicted Zn finger-like uncharacterized protein